MPDTINVYVPISSYISVRSFTNAGFTQRVTLTEENGTTHQYEGSGEHDTPMQGGNFGFTSPSSSQSPLGYRITVKVESYHDGAWQPSSVSSGSCSVMYYYLSMVVSEDYIDQDWNDTSVQFTWWIPPTLREASQARATGE